MINTLVKHLLLSKTRLLIFLLFPLISLAQENIANKKPFPIKYVNTLDQKILLKTITLAPVYDNVQGVYSGPIQKLLTDLLENDKTLGYSPFNFSKKFFIENFDNEEFEVLRALEESRAQGMLTAFITKGPRGLSAKLKLFTQDQGYLLIEDSFQDLNTFEISKLREKFTEMYLNIKNKLPYRGYVLSRRSLDITVNLGSMNGILLGQEITLAQILKINRHPKMRHMVGVEKEIIAKAKVTKVEPYLSFAQIIFEKETGVVTTGAKVLPTEYAAYPIPILNEQGQVIGDSPAKVMLAPVLDNSTKAESAISDSAVDGDRAQLLDRNNTTGFVTIQGVVSQYKESSSLVSGNTARASQDMALGAYLGIQYGFMQNYFFDLSTSISMFSADNGLNGSTPFHLSYNFTQYSALVGYNYFLQNDYKLSGALGLANYKSTVSNSTPVALTNTETSGLQVQLTVEKPLASYPITLGGKFSFSLSPKFSESPVSSGSTKPGVVSYGIFGFYPYSDNLRIRGDLSILDISTTFSGAATRTDPATKTSIQSISERIGIDYLF